MARATKTTPVVTPATADDSATTPQDDAPVTTTKTPRKPKTTGAKEAALRAARETTPDVTPTPANGATDPANVTPDSTTTPPTTTDTVDFAPGDWVHAGQNGPVHKAVTPKVALYFRAACGQVFLAGAKQSADGDNSADACSYCATGAFAPPDVDVTPKRGKKATTNETAPAEPIRFPAMMALVSKDALLARESRLVTDLANTRAMLKTVGGSRRGVSTTGERKPATTPAVGNRVTYTDENGATSEMSISSAVKLIAKRIPAAERCVKYASEIANGKSLNARLFLDKDLAEHRIPAGVVAYVGSAEPAPTTDAPADVDTSVPGMVVAATDPGVTPADETPTTTPADAPVPAKKARKGKTAKARTESEVTADSAAIQAA